MAIIKPFRALRPIQMFAPQISSRPYDVVTDDEVKELIKENEISFLRVTRADVVCESSSPYESSVYVEAANFFDRLKEEECFVKEDEEQLFIYELKYQNHSQTGIAGVFSVDEYENNIILKHEHTRIEKEDDRANHILKTKAQTGPAYLTYHNRTLIDSTVELIKNENNPLFNFTDDEQVTHIIWTIPTEYTEVLIDEFSKLDHLYIADGHHRSASAARIRKEMYVGKHHPANYFLAVAFPSNQLSFGSCNRLVLSKTEISKIEFINELANNFYVDILENPDIEGIKLFMDNTWYLLKPKKYIGNKAVENIDSYIVQELIFKSILNIDDPRSTDKLDYIRDNKGTKILEEKVNSGEALAAITVEPVTMKTLMEIAESGDVMPPKSTWFYPKMRDGLLIHEID